MKHLRLMLAFGVLCSSCVKKHNDLIPSPPAQKGFLLNTIRDNKGKLMALYTYGQDNHLVRLDIYDSVFRNGHAYNLYTYNSSGLLATAQKKIDTEGGGITYRYTYAAQGYAYEPQGRVIQCLQMGVPGVSATYSYNSMGQLLHVSSDDGGSIDLTYDVHGNAVKKVSTHTDAATGKITTYVSEYTYDGHPHATDYLDYVPRDNIFEGDISGLLATFAASVSLNNMISNSGNGLSYAYTYNKAGYPASITVNSASQGWVPYTVYLDYIPAY